MATSLRGIFANFGLRFNCFAIAHDSARTVTTSSKRYEAQIIDGTAMAKQISLEVKKDIDSWVSSGRRPPHLTAILVANDPASETYVKNKMKACKAVGITSNTIHKPGSLSEEELLDLIHTINKDSTVDGLLVQLPLPCDIDERTICNAVRPEKDVDGFHVSNIGRLCLDIPSILPATAAGIWEMLQRTGVETFAKTAVVCGRSKNVGMPIAMLLHTDHRHQRPGGDATVTITHRHTQRKQLELFTKTADILVVAAGIPGLITADMVKEGSCVIDVGINRVKDKTTGKTKLIGDVVFDEVKKVAGYITPVPGGVGPMTVAMLCKNTLTAARGEIQFEDH